MDALPWLLIVVFAATALFFAACNFALRTLNGLRLEEELARRGRLALLEPALTRLSRLILTTATLRILFNVALILTLTLVARNRWAQVHWVAHLLITGAAAFVLIALCSLAIPSAWARYAGESLLARALPLLQLLERLLRPLTAAMHWLDEIVRRLSGAERIDQEQVERQILSAVSEGQREGVVDAQEKEMIESVLEFQDTRADQIMTPRTDIVALDVGSDLETVLKLIHEAGHSRIPVYDGNLDNVVGVLYAKDLLWRIGQASLNGSGRLPAAGDQPAVKLPLSLEVRNVMRAPLFVPESRSVSDLLNDLRRRKVHMAVVLDEFGGTAGLVTIEDILEEIVGEIADEHEQPEPSLIRRIDSNVYEVDGRAHVDDLNDELDLQLPEEEDYDTISGLVISRLGHIPKAGERVQHANLLIIVTQAEPRKINRLRLEIQPLEQAAS